MSTGTKLTRLTPEIQARLDDGADLEEVERYAGRHRTTEDLKTKVIRPEAITASGVLAHSTPTRVIQMSDVPAAEPAADLVVSDPVPVPDVSQFSSRLGVLAMIRRNLGKFRP